MSDTILVKYVSAIFRILYESEIPLLVVETTVGMFLYAREKRQLNFS